MLRTKFVSEIFLFDASLYFLCNLKINSVFHWVDIYPCLLHYYSLLFSIFDYLTILWSRLCWIIGNMLHIWLKLKLQD